MMRRAALLAAALAVGAGACDLGPSKMAHGELYHAGDARYDPYFDTVHAEQMAAESWPDERKTIRKPLASALSLRASASDDDLTSATRERAHSSSAATVVPAADYARRAEIERAKKMKAEADKLDDLVKRGKDLEEQAKKDFENSGAQKADDKKVDKSRELRRELGGAVDACSDLSHDARRAAREAETFADELGRAIGAKKAADEPKPEEKKPEEKKPEEKKPEPAKPSSKPRKPEAPPPPPPPAADKPAPPKPPDEVFNP